MTYYIEEMDERIIKVGLIGYVDDETGDAFLAELNQYIEAASVEKPLYILTGRDSTTRTSKEARRRFTLFAQDPRLGSVAITQSNPFIKVLATFIIKASGRSNLARFFDTEEEGFAWLKEQRDE